MAYSGYLIKFGSYIIPEKFIGFDTYSVLYSTTDLDSYRDADGILHRSQVLDHKVGKVEFSTPYINSKDFNTVMASIREQYVSPAKSKTAMVSCYIPEINDYISQNMYIPDITVQIHKKNTDGSFLYEPVRFAFIGY